MAAPERGGWLWRPLLGASLSQIVLFAVRPAASYAGLELGADPATIGIIAASFAVLPMLIALPLGAFAGRLSRIAIVPFFSGMLLIAACIVGAMTTTVAGLLAACALIGVSNLGILLGAQAWISRSAPATSYNDGFGWMTAGMALGQAAGPLLAGFTVGPVNPSREGISLTFWLCAVLAVPVVAAFASGAVRRYASPGNDDAAGFGSILRTPGVTRAIVVSAAVLTSVDILTAYLPVLGAQAGISPAVIGSMLAVRGISSMLSRLLLGPLGRRFGQRWLIVASVLGAAACLAVIAALPAPAVMFSALAIGGFLLGMGQPLTMTAVAVALPARQRSSGLAMRLLGNRVAQLATPLLAGAVASVFGVASVMVVQVAALTASGIWEAAVREPPREH
ncbi:MFS transporter [Microbacterium sp. WCS2018Hpa-9]|uniref:MFS transporter n=1 Tax=Microbacterium sp. WCS2018Hpa-9 TaxID=3073635 RepID=UPI0028891C06|nr:MFS transporter [Microbacterium sp. WCS2018Hpa-9]